MGIHLSTVRPFLMNFATSMSPIDAAQSAVDEQHCAQMDTHKIVCTDVMTTEDGPGPDLSRSQMSLRGMSWELAATASSVKLSTAVLLFAYRFALVVLRLVSRFLVPRSSRDYQIQG